MTSAHKISALLIGRLGSRLTWPYLIKSLVLGHIISPVYYKPGPCNYIM